MSEQQLATLTQHFQDLTTACDTLASEPGSSAAWDKTTQACQALADLCKQDQYRSSQEVTEALSSMASLYSSPNPPESFLVQSARLLGNACADYDENRAKIMETGIIKEVFRFLNHYPHDSLVVRNLTGFLLNWTITNDPGREAIISQNEYVLSLVKGLQVEGLSEKECTINMFFLLSLFSNLSDDSKFTDAFRDAHGPKPLVDVVRASLTNQVFPALSDSIQNLSLSLLCHVSQQMDEAQDAIVRGGLIPLVLEFIQNPENDRDEEEEEEEEEKEGSVAKRDTSKDPQPFKGPRASAVKILIHGLMSDHWMDELFQDIPLRKSLLKLLKNKEDSILAMTAAHGIGNLVRKESHCIELLESQDDLADPAGIIIQRLKEASEVQDLRLEHALAGLVKNLSIPRQNKQLLGERGAIHALEPLLDRSILPLVMVSVGTMKHLTQGNVDNAALMVKAEGEGPSPLQHLLATLEKNDDPGVKSEGGRVVVNMVRLLSTPHPEGDHDQGRISASDSFAAYTSLKLALDGNSSILDPCLWMVVWSKFAILRNDGLLALIILSQHSDAMRKLVAESIPRSIQERGAVKKGDDNQASSSSSPSQEGTEEKEKEQKGQVWKGLISILAGEGEGVEGGLRCNTAVLLTILIPELKSLGLMQEEWTQKLKLVITSINDEPFHPEGSKELISLLGTLEKVLSKD
ncbi:MAG: armadillo-type protein [Piptocephalis tieghemiana]|nr:MAG: armadillo-type protein [Piptocephalis tieghemiana]